MTDHPATSFFAGDNDGIVHDTTYIYKETMMLVIRPEFWSTKRNVALNMDIAGDEHPATRSYTVFPRLRTFTMS